MTCITDALDLGRARLLHTLASNGLRRVVMLAVSLVGVSSGSTPAGDRAAIASPITFNSALPVHSGEVIVREQVWWMAASDGPAPTYASLDVVTVPTLIVWGVSARLTLMAEVPFVHKNETATTPLGDRVHRRVSGLGDSSLMARWIVLALNGPGRTLRLAPFSGLRVPTSAHNRTDAYGTLPRGLQLGTGGWGALVGMIATWQTLRYEVDASASYAAQTSAHEFREGAEIRLDSSLQIRVVPLRSLGDGVPHFLYAVAETRVSHRAEDRGSLAADGTGGWSWYATPGLQYVTQRTMIEAAVELPIAQPADRHVDFRARLGIRVSF